MNRAINMRALLLSLASLSFALPAASQLHESISVDGRYVPDVIRIDRINAFPKALKSSLTSNPIGYESRGVTASFIPSLVTLPATGWRADRTISDNRGYLELGAGSWLNSTLSAGYRFIDNSTTLFGLRLQHNSTSLWKPELSELTAGLKQYRYDESIGLYGSHVIKGYGRLDASLDYHVGTFNYYGFAGYESSFSDAPMDPVTDAPSQTLNDVAFRVDWRSLVGASSRMTWNATARLRHFAYRALPLPPAMRTEERLKGGRETNFGLEGGVRMPWDNGSSIGLDANLDLMFLSNMDLDNYGMLTLTPYYRFSKGLLDIRLGTDVDLSFNAGEKGERYSFIHVAPDVRLGVQTGQVGVYLNVTGGSQLTTLSRLYQLDYYGMPSLSSTTPTFSPLDAAFGLNLGPFSGFSLGLKARYQSMKNIPLGGWYMTWLNYADKIIPGLEPEHSPIATVDYCGNPKGIDLHGYSLSGYIGYEYGKVFNISAEGTYQPQKGKKGFFNGYDRPEVTLNGKIGVRPVSQLGIGASCELRGKRKIYTLVSELPSVQTTVINGQSSTFSSLALRHIAFVNLEASWDFTKDFSVWLQADNILNRHDDILPSQLSQGVVIVGGFKWTF